MTGRRAAWVAVFVLAIAHPLTWAMLMPPWAIGDEEQHFDYAARLAAGDGPPELGVTHLRSDVALDVWTSQRWPKFGWPTPPDPSPESWGLEGYSYEGHQPPLYYAVLALPLAALDLPVRTELYLARILTLAASLITVLCLRRALLSVWPDRPERALMGCLILVAMPARAVYVSRVSNDVAVEVLGALVLMWATRALFEGFGTGRAFAIGAALGAAMLTKTTTLALGLPVLAVWLHRRSEPGTLRRAIAIAVPVVAAGVVFLLHLSLRAHPETVEGTWSALRNYEVPPFSPPELARGLASLFTSFWLAEYFFQTWRYAGGARGWAAALVFWPVFAVLVGGVCAAAGLRARALWRTRTAPGLDEQWCLLLLATVAGAATMLFVLTWRGLLPAPQGRLLLPYTLAILLPLCWALGQHRVGPPAFGVLLAALIGLSVVWLLDRELAAFYLRSPWAQGSHEPFAARVLSDKPAWAGPIALMAALATVSAWLGLAGLGGAWLRSVGRARSTPERAR